LVRENVGLGGCCSAWGIRIQRDGRGHEWRHRLGMDRGGICRAWTEAALTACGQRLNLSGMDGGSIDWAQVEALIGCMILTFASGAGGGGCWLPGYKPLG